MDEIQEIIRKHGSVELYEVLRQGFKKGSLHSLDNVELEMLIPILKRMIKKAVDNH